MGIGKQVWAVLHGQVYTGKVTHYYPSDERATGSVELDIGTRFPLNVVFDHCPERYTASDAYGSYTAWR